jgi:hypothetical protein
MTTRLDSVQTSIAAIRKDLPATEWRAGQMLSALAEMTGIVGDLAATQAGKPACQAEANERDTRRKATVEHLLWLACRALAADQVDAQHRDGEVRRILLAWGVSETEFKGLGYGG